MQFMGPAAGGAIERNRPLHEQQAARLPGQLTGPEQNFRSLLDNSLRSAGGLKFSAHALQRLESRGIRLGAQEVQALEGAVQQAASKGSRDSLVLGEKYALLVNVPSRTVVTALDQQGLREGVVTNIDSAVWL
ncbi:hypothetical protein IT575_15580 [bacterium]|nr:hypothetical protein [bacterium]